MKKNDFMMKMERKFNNFLYSDGDFRFPKLPWFYKLFGTDASPDKKSIDKSKTLSYDMGLDKAFARDYYEMLGKKSCSFVSYYKGIKGEAKYQRHMVFSGLEVKGKNGVKPFKYNFKQKVKLFLDSTPVLSEKILNVTYKSGLITESDLLGGATVTRSFYQSVNYPALIEKIEILNKTKDKTDFKAAESKFSPIKKFKADTVDGKVIEVGTRLVDGNGDFRNNKQVEISKVIVPNGTAVVYLVHYAVADGEILNFNTEKEIKERTKIFDSTFNGIKYTIGNEGLESALGYSLFRYAEACLSDGNAEKDGFIGNMIDNQTLILENTKEKSANIESILSEFKMKSSPYGRDFDANTALIGYMIYECLGLTKVSDWEVKILPKAKAKASNLYFNGVRFELDALSTPPVIKIGSKSYTPSDGQNVFDFEALEWKNN